MISFDDFSIEVCSLGCNWWVVIIGLINALVDRRHAIISTNEDTVQRRIYATLWADEF